jgi:hypothetical protein
LEAASYTLGPALPGGAEPHEVRRRGPAVPAPRRHLRTPRGHVNLPVITS